MLLAISGSQGSGKTMTIEELKKIGFEVVERKTSRSIQKDWGKDLDEINNDVELTKKFQDEISLRKFQDEMGASAAHPNNVVLTERTFADLATYALLALGTDRTTNDWYNEYFKLCQTHQRIYDHVFYIKGGYFSVVADVNRANHNPYYCRASDIVMLDMTRQMTPPSKLTIIDTPSLCDRVDIIKQVVDNIKE